LKQIYFITGTDTGVGKSVLTCLFLKSLRARGLNAAALKPICSGGRGDARKIFSAMNGALTLDEINPWHFRAPLAPLLAARLESRKIELPRVLDRLRAMQKRFDVLIVEGAGGLLSPLGGRTEKLDVAPGQGRREVTNPFGQGKVFCSRDLIFALRATPIVVAPNQLGVVNHVLLTLESLPKNSRSRAKVVLMAARKPDSSVATNRKLLAEFLPWERIFLLPRLNLARHSQFPGMTRIIGALLGE
jgi:dethiobiotin synthetase